MLGAQLAGTGVELSIAFPGMTTTAMTANWGPEGRAAAAMLRVWGSHAHVTAPQVRVHGKVFAPAGAGCHLHFSSIKVVVKPKTYQRQLHDVLGAWIQASGKLDGRRPCAVLLLKYSGVYSGVMEA